MRIHPVAKRYAKALFELADEHKNLENIISQIRSFSELLKKDKRLRYYFLSPRIEKNQKIQSLESLLKDKVDKIVYNFLLLLIKKNRMEYFEQIVLFLDRFNDKKNNRMNAQLTSVVPLEQKQIKEISEIISKSFESQVVLENKVNPEILGGIIVQIEGKIIDDSILYQLRTLKQKLKKTKTFAV
ncbi:ATP synthase F1 subunit delta [candidate division KSB1 bacterium]|nr:ATP synthase F1 subunit delta [candidate division KSB1 bacterium]